MKPTGVYKLILPCILALGVYSCSKSKGDDGPANPNYSDTLHVNIVGLTDTVMHQLDTLDLVADVQYVSGAKELESLNIINLPANMTAGITTQLDTPGYQSTVRIIAHYADTGLYHIKVIGANSKLTQEFGFDLHVIP